MLTRRKMLIGTAASSIAAIASEHGVAAARADVDGGFPADLSAVGFLEGGALGAFHKAPTAFNVFLKWNGSAAEVFYKDRLNGAIEVFFKYFNKGWTPVSSIFLKEADSLRNAEAAFYKITPAAAEFFIKCENLAGDTINVFSKLHSNGKFEVSEAPEDGELT